VLSGVAPLFYPILLGSLLAWPSQEHRDKQVEIEPYQRLFVSWEQFEVSEYFQTQSKAMGQP